MIASFFVFGCWWKIQLAPTRCAAGLPGLRTDISPRCYYARAVRYGDNITHAMAMSTAGLYFDEIVIIFVG